MQLPKQFCMPSQQVENLKEKYGLIRLHIMEILMVLICTPYGSSYYAHRELDIELVAGDVVRSSPTTSDYSHIVGIETDA